MKIATWNINECVGITCNLDNQEVASKINEDNMQEVIDKINENDFDVVCFQEYPVLIDGEETLNKLITDKTALKYYSAYDTYDSYLFEGGRVGVAVFSKYKIENEVRSLFGNPDMTKVSSSGVVYHSFDKGIIKFDINVDGKNYTIITGHAMAFAPFDKTEFDYPESYKPLEDLIHEYKDNNLIVLGDFNSEKVNELMPTIDEVIKDIVKQPTTKEDYEKRGSVQMDYIMIKEDLEPGTVRKIDNFSDHYIISTEVV